MEGSSRTGLGGTSDSEPNDDSDPRSYPRIFLVLGNAPVALPGIGRLPRCGAACVPEVEELAASPGPASTELSIRHIENEARTRMSREQRMETHPARDRLALAAFHPGWLPTASGHRARFVPVFHRRRTEVNYVLKGEFTNLPPLRRPSKLTNYPFYRRCNPDELTVDPASGQQEG